MKNFNEIIQVCGGIFLLIFFALMFIAIWIGFSEIMWKVVGTDTLLIILCYLLDKATDPNLD